MRPEAYQFEKLSDTLEICVSDAHKFGTDAFLLSHFARARRIDRCADLGTGCGIVALLWYRDREEGPVHTDCVDIQPLAIHQLEVTVERAGLQDRVRPDPGGYPAAHGHFPGKLGPCDLQPAL